MPGGRSRARAVQDRHRVMRMVMILMVLLIWATEL